MFTAWVAALNSMTCNSDRFFHLCHLPIPALAPIDLDAVRESLELDIFSLNLFRLCRDLRPQPSVLRLPSSVL